jgi:hypothetical protein
MFKYVLFGYMLLPMIGIYFMENGAYSLSLHMYGDPNGAFYSYLIYFISFFLSYYIVILLSNRRRKLFPIASRDKYNSHFDRNFIWFCIFSFVVVFFVFGGYKVIIGSVNKATFRSELQFGAILYLIVKSLLPAGLCYYALICAENNKFTRKFYLCCLLSAITVLGLGFKLFVVTLFLPMMLVMLSRVSFITLSKLAFTIFCVLLMTTFIFDRGNQYDMSVLEYLLNRATVLTADIPWYIWSMSSEKLDSFPFVNTLISGFGRTPLSFMGISNSEYYLDYSFGPLITTFVGRSEESVINGSTVTGTLFSTALFVFGHKLYFIMPVLMGAFCGYLSSILIKWKKQKKYKYCAILSTYVAFFVIGAINSGDVSKLFAYSSLSYILLSYLFLTFMDMKFFFKTKNKDFN